MYSTTLAETRPAHAWRAHIDIARVDHWVQELVHGYSASCWRCLRAGFARLTSATAAGPVATPGRVEQLRAERVARRAHGQAASGKRHDQHPVAEACDCLCRMAAVAVAGIGLASTLNLFRRLCGVSGPGAHLQRPAGSCEEMAYLDVLTESINNPIRLLLGWFALARRPCLLCP